MYHTDTNQGQESRQTQATTNKQWQMTDDEWRVNEWPDGWMQVTMDGSSSGGKKLQHLQLHLKCKRGQGSVNEGGHVWEVWMGTRVRTNMGVV